MALDDFREIFNLTGQYNLYGSIKQRILEKAKRDLEEHADITFTYDEIKQGRAVQRINFHIHSKNMLKALPGPENRTDTPPQYFSASVPILPDFYEEIAQIAVKEWGVNVPVLKKLVAEFPSERLRQAVETTKYAIERGKIKGKVAGFFVEAVRSAYTIAPEPLAKNLKKAKEIVVPTNTMPIDSAQKKQEDAKNQAYEMERVRILNQLQEDTNLRDRILEDIQRGIFRDFYNPQLSFESNVERPAFYGLVATIFKKLVG